MKKIMIISIAAIAFIGSAFGGSCSPTPAKETAWVYHWKFTGKTTTGKTMKASKATSACSATPKTCAIRVSSSLKIEGYTYFCSPGCGSTYFSECAEANEIFVCKKPIKDSLAGGLVNEIVNIIGKKKKSIEIAGAANFIGDAASYNFTYAGLGKYSIKNSRITSATGNFAGYSVPCECAPSAVWSCDTLSLCCDDVKPTVAYGKWSVKFCKQAAKNYRKNGTLAKLPSWATWKNRD